MEVFRHHVYEYRKGLRNLILHTTQACHRETIESALNKSGISFQIYPLRNGCINVFFGAVPCVQVIRAIGKASLNDYTPEEDFILGTMLGYDRLQQCGRYLRMRKTMRNSAPKARVCCARSTADLEAPAQVGASADFFGEGAA